MRSTTEAQDVKIGLRPDEKVDFFARLIKNDVREFSKRAFILFCTPLALPDHKREVISGFLSTGIIQDNNLRMIMLLSRTKFYLALIYANEATTKLLRLLQFIHLSGYQMERDSNFFYLTTPLHARKISFSNE